MSTQSMVSADPISNPLLGKTAALSHELALRASPEANGGRGQSIGQIMNPNPNPVLRVGQCRQGLDQNLQAQAREFQSILMENPRDARALVGISLIALASHQTESAVQMAKAAVVADPQMIPAWVALGQTLHAAGSFEESEQAYRRALERDGLNALAHMGLGELRCATDRPVEALHEFDWVLSGSPEQVAAHLGRGHALACMGRNEEALRAYEQAMGLDPRLPDPYFAAGFVLSRLHRMKEAEAHYRRAIDLSPDFSAAWMNLGQLLSVEGRMVEAEAALKRSLELSPTLVSGWINLANLERDRCRPALAEMYLRHALEMDEHRVDTLLSLSQNSFAQRDFSAAWKWLEDARAREPNHCEVANVAGILLHAEERFDEALTALEHAESLGSESATSNRGNVLLDMGRCDEALAMHRAAVERAPQHAGAIYNLALTELRMGDWTHGWTHYEARWNFREVHRQPTNFKQPRWQGEFFKGRRILLYAEQGLGDTIQFCRYLPRVVARGGSVTLEVQPAVERLVRSMAAVRAGQARGMVEVIARGATRPSFDLECPLMSLPAVFGTEVDSVSWAGSYLAGDPAAIEPRRSQCPSLHDARGLRVGISWAGNTNYKADAARSMKLETLIPLLRTPGITFVSLQKGASAQQISALPGDLFVWDGCSKDQDFADTAALAASLDLIITTDTAVAHLAGAMGLPVWILLAQRADWRWMEGTSDSPWYPTARLFRQRLHGDWAGLLQEVSAALQNSSSLQHRSQFRVRTGRATSAATARLA